MRQYNHSTVYDCFNNPFAVYCGITYLNIPPMLVDDCPCPKKKSPIYPWSTSGCHFVAPGKSVITLTNYCYSLQFIFLTSNDPNTNHAIMIDNPDHARGKIVYCSNLHGGIICNKGSRFYCSKCYINKRIFLPWTYKKCFKVKDLLHWRYTLHGSLLSLLVCLPTFSQLFHSLKSFMCLFSSRSLDPTLFRSLCMLLFKLWTCVFINVWFNVWDYSPSRQIFYPNYNHACNRILKMGMIWCIIKNYSICWL